MLTHLLELRRRALYTLFGFGILFIIFFTKANTLFHYIVSPLLNILPKHEGLIATQITSPIVTPLKLAADAALFLSTPIALFNVWQFISPGLYPYERQTIRWAMALSITLFLSGSLFCFYLILPFMFQLFVHYLPSGVQFRPDMAYAMDFITRMLLLFGMCFQVPLICWVLVRLKLTHISTLKRIRPYVIVSAFIIGMLLTPPDVLSQIMLAVPLCLLYELGLLLVIFLP